MSTVEGFKWEIRPEASELMAHELEELCETNNLCKKQVTEDKVGKRIAN
jgi:hypothetical protein